MVPVPTARLRNWAGWRGDNILESRSVECQLGHRMSRLKLFVVFLTSSKQMLGYHFGLATTASFQILSSSLFTYYYAIRLLVVQQLTVSLCNPRSLLNEVPSPSQVEANDRDYEL